MNGVPVSTHADDLDHVAQVDDRRSVDAEERRRRQAILERVQCVTYETVAVAPEDAHIVIRAHDPRNFVWFVEESPVAIDEWDWARRRRLERCAERGESQHR